MLIRHAERPVSAGAPLGITVEGTVDPLSLTVVGWQRAGALVELFDPAVGSVRSGLTRPTTCSPRTPRPERRPLETVTPLAQRLKLAVRTPVRPRRPRGSREILRRTSGSPLVAWPHQAIPAIAQQLGRVHPRPPTTWPNDRYDVVWVFTCQQNGTWKFTQVPQLLLAGDRRNVIR